MILWPRATPPLEAFYELEAHRICIAHKWIIHNRERPWMDAIHDRFLDALQDYCAEVIRDPFRAADAIVAAGIIQRHQEQ